MFLLTSYDRIRRYVSDRGGASITDTADVKRELTNMILSVSRAISKYLNRDLGIVSRTEYFEIKPNQLEFFVKASPIVTLTSVYEDSSGLWDGSEAEISDCYVSHRLDSIVLPMRQVFSGSKMLRVIYTGGAAYHATQSMFTVVAGADFTVGRFVKGSTSDAVGIVKAAAATSLIVETLFGCFEAGETLTEYTNEACTVATTPAVTEVIVAVARQSMAESDYAPIVRAADMAVLYYYKHKNDFGVTSSSRDGSVTRWLQSARVSPSEHFYPFQQEVIQLLNPYRNVEL